MPRERRGTTGDQPSGLSQILAASGLSGEALLGSKTGIHPPPQTLRVWKDELTAEKRLERK